MSDYCTQFGFDRKKINQRLAFLYLSKVDHRLAQRLNIEVIAPNVDAIVNRFYDTLLFHPESRKMLLSANTIESLRISQRRYLFSLGKDFDSEEYFEERLRIGVIHAVIGLPLNVYQCAYCNLIRFIIDVFPNSITENRQDNQVMLNFLIKITSLDMSLAVETYHFSHMLDLKETVEEFHSRESRLRTIAETDSLTGLSNRGNIFNHLAKAVNDAHKISGNLCVLMVDLDHFKKINDTHGHQTGDKVLIQAARCISEAVRSHDIVGRYGGEEFIVGVINADADTASIIAERIRKHISGAPIKENKQPINITASIGLACLNEEDDMQSLVHRADVALYSAKHAGRNRLIVG